jgi:alkylhydroperoxidase/carboxymuconolactone decarboxylase family protein YurZ
MTASQPDTRAADCGPLPGSLAYFQAHNPPVGDSLVSLIASIYDNCPLDPKTRELIFLGLQTALKASRGIKVHVPRAIEAGATEEEILWAITLALPNAGMNAVAESFGLARELMHGNEPPA